MQMRAAKISMGLAAVLAAGVTLWSGHARAEDPQAAARLEQASVAPEMSLPEMAADATRRGAVTNLPVPRYVSLKASEGNVRRGPSLSHRIDWVFRHRDMPLRVTAEFGHWRRVEDRDGVGGWVHYSLISGVRTVVFTHDKTEMHFKPADDSSVMALAETGAIARVGECGADWCRVSAEGQKGWVRKSDVWGVDPGEIIQ